MSAQPDGAAAAALAGIDALAASLLLTSYASSRPEVVALYERAKGRQWNATTDLPWETIVALDRPIVEDARLSLYGSAAFAAMSPAKRRRYNVLESAWVISQFMHGEQASLIACGQLMAALPDIDAKFYAASQGYDEARHTEVYRRYLDEKLAIAYPIDPNLKFICDIALGPTEWTMKLVAIQMIIETLALGAFKTLLDSAREPLLLQILTYVMADEARHVAFGRLALQKALRASAPSDRDRYEDFLATCVRIMHSGFHPDPVFEELALGELAPLHAAVQSSEQRVAFRRDLFSQLIPSALDVGLITARTVPVYEELGIALR